MASRQVFYKSPGAVWDFRVAINVGEATLSAPTAVILDSCGQPVAEGNAKAPTATAPTIEGSQINVRVSGGAKDSNWYLRVNANLSDGRKAEKYVPLVIQYPIEPEADPIVVSMGGGEGITQAQLTAAIRAEAQARETADNALRGDVDANKARRLVGVAFAGRTFTFTYPSGTAAETIELPDMVVSAAIDGQTLTFTHIGGDTTEITLPMSGGGGGQTAQEVRDAIATEIAKLDIPPRLVSIPTLFALVSDDNPPALPVIPANRLQPAGQGFTAGDVVVAPWTQTRPTSIPAGQTLWAVSVLIFADNTTLTGGLVHASLSSADRVALDSIATLRNQLNATHSAAIWARDRGDGGRLISDSAIPAAIARDSELSELLDGAVFSDGLFTLTRHNGNNPIQLRIIPSGGTTGQLLARASGGGLEYVDAPSGGGSGAADSVVSITARGGGKTAEIVYTTRGGGTTTAIGYPSVPIPDGQADNAKVLTADGEGGYAWQTIPNTGGGGGSGDVTTAQLNTALAVRDSEIATLSQLVFANIIPAALTALAHDLTLTAHPAGVWLPTPTASVKMVIGGAFLFENASVTRTTIQQEIAAVSGYTAADLTGMNFVRIHSDPNEDTNPFVGVTPYCVGAVDITTPAELRQKVISFVFGQMSRGRPTSRALDADTTFLQFGDTGLIRWSDQGIDVRIGRSTAINQQVTHFERADSINLSSLAGAHTFNLASRFTGATRRVKLTANVFIADESVARSSPSVEVNAAAAPTNFSIPIAGRVALTGNIAYNGSTRALTINITGGSKEFNSHIQLDIGVQITETINIPAREEFTGLLGATSLSPGVADVFRENAKNVAVFAFEKQYDEPDSPDNLMTMFWRINRLTGRVNLRQRRRDLELDSAKIKVGAPTTYISHLQPGSADENLSETDLLALDPEVKGWGQLSRQHRDNEWALAAKFSAHGISIANPDGTKTALLPPASWAREGDGTKIPAEKIPVSVSAPSGIILPRVIGVPHFTAQTADIDLGFKLDGAGGVRSQYDELIVPWEVKKGRDQREIGRGNHRWTRGFKSIPLDALPGESTIQATGSRWDRYVELDFYPDTLQRVALHIWQENDRVAPVAGQPPVDPISNLHINLVYWNNSDNRNYLAPLPGGITHYDGLSIAAFHDTEARQVYLMPRSAKGEPGDKGDKGDRGEQGLQGERGLQGVGIKGDTGEPGANGRDGVDGSDGRDGRDGVDGRGVPAGGGAGQILAKSSAADFATAWINAPTGGGGGSVVDAAVSNRIGFAVAGIDSAGVSRATLLNTVNRAASTGRNANVAQAGNFHKLSFAAATTAGFSVVDARGNIRFANNDYKNILLFADFPIAQLTTPTGGNARMELGFAIVGLAANGSRTLRKIVKGQYMRNNTNDPPFRTANVMLQRSLTLPDPFAGETWEVYLFAESQVAGAQLRINAEWNHTTGAAEDAVGGGAVVIGIDDAVATAASEGGGGGGGLDQAAVDARIVAQTKVYARSGQRAIEIGDIDPALAARYLPTTGAANGRFLGYAGGIPTWMNAPAAVDQTARTAAQNARTAADTAAAAATTADGKAVAAKTAADNAAAAASTADGKAVAAQNTANAAKTTADGAATAAATADGKAVAAQSAAATADRKAVAAQTDATQALTNAGQADDKATQAKSTADAAAAKNITQDTAIGNAQRDASAAINKNSQQDTAIAAIRQVPAGGSAGQLVAVASGGSDLTFVDPPSGGGGVQVSGTSGWGENLLSSDLVTAHNGIANNLSASTRTINLSGDVDSILVVAGEVADGVSTPVLHRGSVEIVAPMTAGESHQIVIETTRSGGGSSLYYADFSFPTTTGAQAQIRFDRDSGIGSSSTVRIIGVYKKTRITGEAGGAQSGGTTDTTARAAAATADAKAVAAQAAADTADRKAVAAQSTADSATTAAATADRKAVAAQATADTATTPAEATALIKPFARQGGSTLIAGSDIAAGAINSAKIDPQTPLTTSQASAVDAKIAAHTPPDTTARTAAATADAKAQGAVDANTRQDTAIAANSAKVGVPDGGNAGQGLKREQGGGLGWADDNDSTARAAAATADGKAVAAKTAADSAQATADAATTPAEAQVQANRVLTQNVKAFARTNSLGGTGTPASLIAAADIGANAVTAAKIQNGAVSRDKIANGAIDATKIDPQTGLTTAQTAAVAQQIAAHESDNSHPDDGLNQSQVRSEIDSRVESFARVGSGVALPQSKIPNSVATTAALAQTAADVSALQTKEGQQDTLIAANTAKTGVPAGGSAGQVLGVKDGAPNWQAAPSSTSPTGSIEPSQIRARILEQVLQSEKPSANFSVYTFANAADNFTYNGRTGRIDRARLTLQNSLLELRWTGFTSRSQLAGLSVRITSNGVAQEFAADSGTDFNLGESSYPNVNTAGLSAHPLAIDVYIAEHDDMAKVGDVAVVADDDSFVYENLEGLVAVAPKVLSNERAAQAAQARADAAHALATTANQNAATADAKAVSAQSAATTADGKAVSAQTTANSALQTAQVADAAALQARTNAATAQNTANTAKSTADTAIQRAQTAQSTANSKLSPQETDQRIKDFARTGGRQIQAGDIANGVIPAAGITSGQASNLIKPFARAGGSTEIATADIDDSAITLDKLAAAVVARLVPTGGSTDQVLVRTSDGGIGWGTLSGATIVPPPPPPPPSPLVQNLPSPSGSAPNTQFSATSRWREYRTLRIERMYNGGTQQTITRSVSSLSSTQTLDLGASRTLTWNPSTGRFTIDIFVTRESYRFTWTT